MYQTLFPTEWNLSWSSNPVCNFIDQLITIVCPILSLSWNPCGRLYRWSAGWSTWTQRLTGAVLDDADFGDVRDLPLFAFLQPGELGPWPLLMLEPGSQPQEHASLEHLIGTLAALQVHSFVDIFVTQDERNASQYILQVQQLHLCMNLIQDFGCWESEWLSPPPRRFNCLNYSKTILSWHGKIARVCVCY